MAAPMWIGTGWKMNHLRAASRAYADALLASGVGRLQGIQPFVFPPSTVLAEVADALSGSGVLGGAQTMHWAESGAYTGEISAAMVRDCGASLVELGHSERRALFNETDPHVNLKVHSALTHGLRPLVCVGETAEERNLNAATDTVSRQLRIALAGVGADDLTSVIIAYEPVWAIGETGTPATPDEAEAMHRHIRDVLSDLGAEDVPMLYGGSVNFDNAVALAAQPAIDGLFIGRAAWRAEGLIAIIRAVHDALSGAPGHMAGTETTG